MAASIARTLPRTLNHIFSRRLGCHRVQCCCYSSKILTDLVLKCPNAVKSYDRPLSTCSRLQKQDMVEPMKEVADEIDEDSNQEELDVLYKRVNIEVKGHDREVLKSYEEFVKLACQHLQINIGHVFKPKYDVLRQSVQRSVHVHKKHYTQFEQRTYFLIFEIPKLTGSTADTLLEYIQRNLPEGVAMKVTKHRIEKIPEHLKPPTSSSEQTQPNT